MRESNIGAQVSPAEISEHDLLPLRPTPQKTPFSLHFRHLEIMSGGHRLALIRGGTTASDNIWLCWLKMSSVANQKTWHLTLRFGNHDANRSGSEMKGLPLALLFSADFHPRLDSSN